MKKKGIKFKDVFVGEERFGCHLSKDGMNLYSDPHKEVYEKRVETNLFVYYQDEADGYIMLGKDENGAIDRMVSNNHFAETGLLDALEQIWTGKGEEYLVWMDKKTTEYMPEFAEVYEWGPKNVSHSKNARQISFTEVEFQGQKALFTEWRVSRSSVPKPLHYYNVRHEDENWAEPAQIAHGVTVNYLGALIMEKPLDLGKDGRIYLERGEFDPYRGKQKSLVEFARDQNIKLKKKDEMER